MVEISVLIPSHNVEKYIRECLDSIVNQTFEDMEIICVDDGSTDSTLNILNEYALKDSRMRVYENKENKGVGYTRNYLLSLAKGKYIYFMDSDDYLELDALEKAYNVAEEKSLDILMFKIRNFKNRTKREFESVYTEMHYLEKFIGDRIFTYEDVKRFAPYICVNLPGKLLKRDLVQDIKFPNRNIFEDNPFFFEALLRAKGIYFFREYLCNKRERENSIMESKDESYLLLWSALDNVRDVAKRYDKYEELKPYFVHHYISLNQQRIREVNLKTKFKFFKKMKEYYICNEKEIKEVYDEIPFQNQTMYDACIQSDNYIAYESRVLYRISRNLKQYRKDVEMENLIWKK